MSFARYVVFESDLDSVEELPLSLLKALRAAGIETARRVGEEDEGWWVTFRHNGVAYEFCSRFDITSEPLECMGWLQRKTGFFASFLSPRETYTYPELEPVIESALASVPSVRALAWCSGDD
jgi:hypothetical protein